MSSNPAVVIGVTAVDKASGVLKSLDQQVAGTTSKVEQSNAKAAASTERTSTSMVKAYGSIAASIAGLSAGIVSFTTSFSDLNKAELAVETQTVGVARARDTLAMSELRLQKMRETGTATTEQLAAQEQKVITNRQNLELYNGKLAQSQDDLSDSYANFYAQIPMQLISFGTSAVMAYTAYTSVTATATGATKAFNIISKLAFLTNPIGIVIMGVATVVALLATNTFGLRDAFVSAGKVVHEFLEVHFKPLADLISWFIDGLNALGAGLNTDAIPAFDAASTTVADFNGELVNTQIVLGTGLPAAVTVAEQSLHGLDEKIDSTAKRARTLNEMVNSFNRGESGVTYTNEVMSNGFTEPHVKVNGRWVPKDDHVFGNTTRSLQDYIQRRNYSKSFDNGFDLSSIQALERRFDKPALDIEISFVDKGTHYEVTATSAGKSRTFIAQKKTYMRDMIA